VRTHGETQCLSKVETSTGQSPNSFDVIVQGQHPNTGPNLGHPVVFFFCRIFSPLHSFGYCPRVSIQLLDGFITQWVFSFLPLQLPRILSTDSHSATGRDYGSPNIVGFSFFTTNHATLNGSIRWGSPLRPPPWAQSLILTVHGLGLIPPDTPTGPYLHL